MWVPPVIHLPLTPSPSQNLNKTPRGSRQLPPNATARQQALSRAEALLDAEIAGGVIGRPQMVSSQRRRAADMVGALSGMAPSALPGGDAGPGAAAVGSSSGPGASDSSSALSEAIASLVSDVAPHTGDLWSSLSALISEIEERMSAPPGGGAARGAAEGGAATAIAPEAGNEASGSGVTPPAPATAASAAATAAAAGVGAGVGAGASKALPPGAAQVLPLVEAFFVICALQARLVRLSESFLRHLLVSSQMYLCAP